MEFLHQHDHALTALQVESMLLNHSTIHEIKGTDGDKNYKDIAALWKYFYRPKAPAKTIKTKSSKTAAVSSTSTASTVLSINNEPEFYKQAFDYWESPTNCPVTDNGVLGGYGHLTPDDARDSLEFLDELQRRRPGLKMGPGSLAADCGSGIGRVSKSVLLKRFDHVVLVEQSPRLTHAVHRYLAVESAHGVATAVNLYNRRLKERREKEEERNKQLQQQQQQLKEQQQQEEAAAEGGGRGGGVNVVAVANNAAAAAVAASSSISAAPPGVFNAVDPTAPPPHNSMLLVLAPLTEVDIEKRVCCWCVGLQHLFQQPHYDAFSAFDTPVVTATTANPVDVSSTELNAAVTATTTGWKRDSTSLRFDAIWIQWVVGHLNDADYISFFRRCAEQLAPNGVIVIKDNVTDDFTYMIDTEDSSVARCLEYHKGLLEMAHPDLKCVYQTVQRDFPEDLCPVYIMAFGLPEVKENNAVANSEVEVEAEAAGV